MEDATAYKCQTSHALIQYLEKPRGYPGEYCPLGVPRPWNLPRDNIHQDTPQAFPHITILS